MASVICSVMYIANISIYEASSICNAKNKKITSTDSICKASSLSKSQHTVLNRLKQKTSNELDNIRTQITTEIEVNKVNDFYK
jgi:hypothetical protein